MSTAQSGNDLLDLVKRTVEVPTIPQVLRRLHEVIADPETAAADVAKVILTDPAVATNILRIVNSAYFGLPNRVASIELAVAVLGFGMTSKIALKAAVFSTFAPGRGKVTSFDFKMFWRHSILTAIAARTLGAHSGTAGTLHAEDLYVCGLLHDIGKLILLQNAPDRYPEVLEEAAASTVALPAIECSTLGFSHADVGSVLAIKWMLPEDLAVAIRYHHAAETDPFRPALSALVQISDAVASNANQRSHVGGRPVPLCPSVYDLAGIGPAAIEGALPGMLAEFEATGLPF